MREFSRREFLQQAGKTALGAAAFIAAPALTGCGAETDVPTAATEAATTAQATEAETTAKAEDTELSAQEIPAITLPLSWHELDKDEVQARVYDQWFKLGGCGAAVFDGFLGVLAEKYGYPYNQFPQEIGFLGHSGYTCGSYCGALGGATLVISLFIPKDNQDDVLKELQAWYTSTVLPIYEGEYDDVHTTAPSVNCVDSLGTWMTAAGVDDRKDQRRKSRCAALSADVAAKTIEIINVFYGIEKPAEASQKEAGAASDSNVFEGSAKGLEGDVKVSVTVDDGKISDVRVLSHSETPNIGTKAIDTIPEQFVGLSTPEEIDAVDAVSGATVTSTALKEAVKAALAKAK